MERIYSTELVGTHTHAVQLSSFYCQKCNSNSTDQRRLCRLFLLLAGKISQTVGSSPPNLDQHHKAFHSVNFRFLNRIIAMHQQFDSNQALYKTFTTFFYPHSIVIHLGS